MTMIDALEQARARLAELRQADDGISRSLRDARNEDTERYEINEINEESPSESLDRHWLVSAQEAVNRQLIEPATVEPLVALRETKYQVLVDAPIDPPNDPTLLTSMRATAAVLTQQTEALGWLIKVFRGEAVDRDRLANLTLREAWRLERHDVFERVWREIEEASEKGGSDHHAVQGS
jgi:hypothetical protein